LGGWGLCTIVPLCPVFCMGGSLCAHEGRPGMPSRTFRSKWPSDTFKYSHRIAPEQHLVLHMYVHVHACRIVPEQRPKLAASRQPSPHAAPQPLRGRAPLTSRCDLMRAAEFLLTCLAQTPAIGPQCLLWSVLSKCLWPCLDVWPYVAGREREGPDCLCFKDAPWIACFKDARILSQARPAARFGLCEPAGWRIIGNGEA